MCTFDDYVKCVVFLVVKLLQENVTALVTAMRCPQRRMVSAMTETFKIPHLSVDLDHCPSLTSEKFTLHLTLENNKEASVLMDLAKATGRKYIQIKFGNRVGKKDLFNSVCPHYACIF